MDALIKGSHAPRVSVACAACGRQFERSAVHPYIVECPDCRAARRGAAAKARASERRVRCRHCRELVSAAAPLGQHVCARYGPAGGCSTVWWSLGNGWWRNTDTDDVFRLGEFRGSLRDEPFEVVYFGVREDPVTAGT